MIGCCRRCHHLADYVSAMGAPLCARHAATVVARGGLIVPIEATTSYIEHIEHAYWADEEATG